MSTRLLRIGVLLFTAVFVASAPAEAQRAQAAIQEALNHVRSNAAEFDLSARDAATLAVANAHESRHNGVAHVYLQQEVQGIPVHNAILSVAVKDGEIVYTSGRLVSDLAQKLVGATPGLSAEDAAEQAVRYLGLSPSGRIEVLEREPSGARKTMLAPAGIAAGPIAAELVYQPTERGEVRLAWEVTVELTDGSHWWQLRLDAATGEVLDQNDLVDHDVWGVAVEAASTAPASPALHAASDAMALGSLGGLLLPDSYRVYPFPFESPQHGATHSVVTNPLSNAPAGTYPAGMTSWHDTDGDGTADFTDTRGNNADAYADRDGDNNPDAGSRPSGGAALDFDFAIDLTEEPDTYTDGSVVNMFYWTNIVHDVVYQYGFDEASGNFQIDNFGRGGSGGDDVRAEAQDGSELCNARFGTPTDGNRPRMQMYECNNATPNRSSDLDAGVIAHEYGHGISTRLTGGPGSDTCLDNDEQMGEGWSDWFLLSLTQRNVHTATDGRGVGTYLFGQGPNGGGIRARPYSTDFAVNEFTYDRIKVTDTSPHGLGHVWATMLWDLNWALIGDLFPEEGGASGAGYVPGFDADLYDGNGGNNLAQQLIVDGMKLQGCSPGFIDGRDAILAADAALTGGQNERIIWKVFARRGLGWSADQGTGSNDRTDGTEAFDMPPSLNRPPTADAGSDQAVECVAPTGTSVTLDGTGSSDPDETNPLPDVLTYSWSGPFPEGDGTVTGAEPTVTLAKGVHVITLTVTDEHDATDTDQVQITVSDTTPPVVTLLGDNPQVLECALEPYVELGATALDVCDGDLTASIVIDASAVDAGTPGSYDVTYTVSDAAGNSGNATRAVTVEDTTPPDLLVSADPVVLWPPDHKYRKSSLLGDFEVTASDACNENLSADDVVATAVSSDEPEDIPDDGTDGATLDDIVVDTACQDLQVRAERRGDANGRVYTAILGVDDGYNVSTADVVIHVPLNRRDPVVDDGPAYTVAACTPVAPATAAVASHEGAAKGDADADAAKDGATTAETETASVKTDALPAEFALDQSYPNPFSASAEIGFALPEAEHVRLTVYDLLGREVRVLVDGPVQAGTHRVRFDGQGLGSGTYLYRMEAGAFVRVRPMVLMR